jgi:hypothetical protein
LDAKAAPQGVVIASDFALPPFRCGHTFFVDVPFVHWTEFIVHQSAPIALNRIRCVAKAIADGCGQQFPNCDVSVELYRQSFPFADDSHCRGEIAAANVDRVGVEGNVVNDRQICGCFRHLFNWQECVTVLRAVFENFDAGGSQAVFIVVFSQARIAVWRQRMSGGYFLTGIETTIDHAERNWSHVVRNRETAL